MNLKKFFAIVLSFAIIFCLCACSQEKGAVENNESKLEEYKKYAPKFNVTVTDTDGNAIDGVILQMRKDIVTTARTNRKGIATFNLYITEGYKLSVVSCPEGYEYTGDEYIYIRKGSYEYSLEITKKSGE